MDFMAVGRVPHVSLLRHGLAGSPGRPSPNSCQAPPTCSNLPDPYRYWRFLYKKVGTFTCAGLVFLKKEENYSTAACRSKKAVKPPQPVEISKPRASIGDFSRKKFA
jgi:hypothetical protein